MSPETDPKIRAWGLLLAAHTALVERIELALASADLPALAWYDVLWELETAPERKLRMHELAQRIVLSRSNLTRLADRLESAGLLAREACPDDRRGNFCVITDAGRAMRKKMWPVYRDQIKALFSDQIDDKQAKVMADGLAGILRVLESDDAA
jgi:DNA-binding MarR family transcriptional regulator